MQCYISNPDYYYGRPKEGQLPNVPNVITAKRKYCVFAGDVNLVVAPLAASSAGYEL